MDPNSNETTAALIARRPERLNILVTRIVSGHRGWRRGRAPTGNGVVLRYGYTALTNDDDLGRPTSQLVPVAGTKYDAAEINSIGSLGAVVCVPDITGIRAAVANLRAAWGPLHVQDNSGLVPDLHQGLWQG